MIKRTDPAFSKVHIRHWTDSWNVDSDIEDKDNNKDEEKDGNKEKDEKKDNNKEEDEDSKDSEEEVNCDHDKGDCNWETEFKVKKSWPHVLLSAAQIKTLIFDPRNKICVCISTDQNSYRWPQQ